MKDKEKQNISMKEMLTKRSSEPITNCNCKIESRIDYAVRNENKDGAFVDLLNQEQVELQKAMIEEMAKMIDDRLIEARVWLGSMNRGKGYWIAQKLVEHYQPKLPENAVVLTEEEAERFRGQTINIAKIKARVRKEMVEKFAKGVKKRTVNWLGETGFFLTYEELDQLTKSVLK